MPSVRARDPFTPQLLAVDSVPFAVSNEQKLYIKNILDIACSDSRFAEKAYIAITRVLTDGPIVPPKITSLAPNTVVIGAPSFDVHVLGTGFTPTSKIVFAGQSEPTTFVSDKELTTGVNMDVWLGPDSVPVIVDNDGVMSDPSMFTFTEAGVQSFVPPAQTQSQSQSQSSAKV